MMKKADHTLQIVIVALTIFAASLTSAQQNSEDRGSGSAKSDDEKMTADIQKAVESSNYLAVYEIAKVRCRDPKIDENDPTLTLEILAKQASDGVRCALAAKANALAATDYDKRAGLDELTDTYVNEWKAFQRDVDSKKDFLGLKWGIGVGYSFGFDDAVDDAVIVDGVVRVKSSKQDQPRVFLEVHKYLACKDHGEIGTRGCGPFVAVAATEDEALGGVALGWMYGWKAKKEDDNGFSVGVGAVLDAEVSDLAEGFVANQPPPGTETQVRFETKSRWSAVVFVTRTW